MAYENKSNIVEVYVRYLREKIDRGSGYRLSVTAQQPLCLPHRSSSPALSV